MIYGQGLRNYSSSNTVLEVVFTAMLESFVYFRVLSYMSIDVVKHHRPNKILVSIIRRGPKTKVKV